LTFRAKLLSFNADM